MNITLDFLAHHTDKIDLLGREIYSQWIDMYTRQNKSVDDVIKTVESRAVTDTIPLTMIALEGDTLLGSVTLKVSDFSAHPELTPWLAGVFVLPQYRKQGVGSKLIGFAENIAKEKFNVETLYLYTGSASGLYEKLGYKTFETVDRGDKILTLMKKEL